MNKLETYIENSELVQLAILEAVHRFVYDECFDSKNEYKQPRPKDDEESKKANEIHKALWCKHPDWRARIKKYIERYQIEPNLALVKSLEITNKPKKDFSQLFIIHFCQTPSVE